jgi:hypothetical protein
MRVAYSTRLRAPFSLLAELLGPPSDYVPEKCSTIWYVDDGGVEITVKDWQDEDDASFKVELFRGLPAYDWEVIAPDRAIADGFAGRCRRG